MTEFITNIETTLEVLRLRLRRQVLWQRHLWAEEPGARYQGLAITDAEVDAILDGSSNWAARDAFFMENSEAAALSNLLEKAEAGDNDSPLNLVRDLFLLSGFERNALLLALAVELAPGLERAYAYIQDDAGLLLPTPSLALSLFSSGSAEAVHNRGTFTAESPLFRHNILAWATPGKGGLLSRPFRVDERILEFVTGSNQPDQRIAPSLTVLREKALPAELFAGPCALLENRVRSVLGSDPATAARLIVNLVGKDSASCRTIATEVCRRLGVSVLNCDLEDLPADQLPAREALPLVFREALLQPAAIFLELSSVSADAGETGAASHSITNSLLRAASDYAALTFVVSEHPWPARLASLNRLGCVRVELTVPPLNFSQRHRLWQEALTRLESPPAGKRPEELAADLANRFHFAGDQIDATLQRAVEASALSRGSAPDAVDIAASARAIPVHNLEILAQKVASAFTWEDIVLPDDAREQLAEIAAQFRHRQKVYGEWGFEKKMDRGKGICVLFSGPSGTGKTMAAEILSNDLGLELYRIDLSAVVSKYIGETEKNLRKVFDEGEKSQAILFFDEADALFGKRSEVRDSHDRYANIEINYLLQRMESYTGASILATNMRAAIDPAFLRRLRTIVEFPLPDTGQRETIWRKSFPAAAEVNGVDFRYLAKHFEISGGNIKNAALNAAFLAAAGDETIAMDHVTRAVRREYAKMGKLCVE